MARSSHAPARSCVLGASAVIAILLASLAALLTAATPGGAPPGAPVDARGTKASTAAPRSTTASPSASPTASGPAAATVRAKRGHHADDGQPALRAGAARIQRPAVGERHSPPPALGTPGCPSGALARTVHASAATPPASTSAQPTYDVRLRAPPRRPGN
ncbi:hypothetical protein ACFC00_40790 [Streptomyces adustus]|uniref:hypothetical protein n=1 Tax=Streptomyces adustus TaxID=1609272 RepID=UPI0035DDC62F